MSPDQQPAKSPKTARGFALYVGIDEATAAANGIDLSKLVEALKNLTSELAPSAETYAAVALAPESAGGRDVDVVRLALQEPSAVSKVRSRDEKSGGVVVDISRKRVLIDDEPAPLTFKEFELLQYLVLHKGQTVSRTDLIAALWRADEEDIPNDRTIDVHDAATDAANVACIAKEIPHQLRLEIDDDGRCDALRRYRIDHELDSALVIKQHQRVFIKRAGLFAEFEEFLRVEQALVVAFQPR